MPLVHLLRTRSLRAGLDVRKRKQQGVQRAPKLEPNVAAVTTSFTAPRPAAAQPRAMELAVDR